MHTSNVSRKQLRFTHTERIPDAMRMAKPQYAAALMAIRKPVVQG
jgi:hypothetical protein